MNNTPRTNDSTNTAADDSTVIPKRRATDWQPDEAPKKKRLSVTKPDVFGWHEGDGLAFIDDRGMARITASLSGARTIAAILMQRELDRNNEDDENPLNFDEATVHGLFNALASCIEVAEHHAAGDATWTTQLTEFDTAEAEHMRRAARDASINKANRRALEHVELLNRCKAAKAARGAA